MNLQNIRTEIEQSISLCTQKVRLSGIDAVELQTVPITPKQLKWLADQLEQAGYAEIVLSSEVNLYVRISNTDLLVAPDRSDFLITMHLEDNVLRSLAKTEKDWKSAWQRAIEPLKEASLKGMRRDILNIDDTLAERSYTFQAAMVLLASELVGPYVDRIATFLSYPVALVQVIGARLQEGGIWDGDVVRCEHWFDPKKGGAAFLLDLMIAEGTFTRRWSEEKMQYAYQPADITTLPKFAI